MTEGQAGVAHSQPVTAVLPALGRGASQSFPLDAAGVNAIFGNRSQRLALLHASETEVLAKLQTAL